MLPIHYLILISRNGSPYSEVTVVSLPSSLMIVHSNAFVFSTSLLVVVSRYGFCFILLIISLVCCNNIICYCFSRTFFTLIFFFIKKKRFLLFNKNFSHRLIL